MNRTIRKQQSRVGRRERRVRVRVRGSDERPRLSVFRSQRHLSAQLIDDGTGRTLVAASDGEIKAGKPSASKAKLDGIGRAAWVGAELAQKAKAKGITAARFDRGRYRYHGLIAALAEGARKGGLKF